MLKKIISIKNVGKFLSYKAVGDVELRRLNLIYGENARGKTTLCDIYRSLRTGDSQYIMGRSSLGKNNDSEILIRLESRNATFKDQKWDEAYPDIEIFDSTFIHENVYAGDSIDHTHKKNLYQIIVGQEGVKLATEISVLDTKIREHNSELALKKANLQKFVSTGFSFDNFVSLKQEDNLAEKLKLKTTEFESLNNSSEILSKAQLKRISVSDIPENFISILGKELDDISSDVESHIRQHISEETNNATEDWLSQGVSYIKDDSCPFCNLSIKSNELVEYYKKYFGESYAALSDDVSDLQGEIKAFITDLIELKFLNTINENDILTKFWNKYESFNIPDLNLEQLIERMKSLQSCMDDLTNKKQISLLERISPGEDYSNVLTAYEEIKLEVSLYNQAVTTANELISSRKDTTKGGNLETVNAELIRLIAIKERFEDATDKLCLEYNSATQHKKKLDSQKKTAKEKLDKYSSKIISKFELRINQLLKNFGTSFRIGETNRRYIGGTPSTTFQVIINDVPVTLGNSSTSISQPCFRNTLSAGDKSTLALAFFITQLELDPNLDQKIVILDDPFTSQDRSRRTYTQQLICKVAEKSKQTIVLSHEPRFLRLLWNTTPNAEIKTLQLCRLGKENTAITCWNIQDETSREYFQNYALLTTFANEGTGDSRHVALAIRPVLEEYLRFRLPFQFEEDEWLGDFISKIRNAEANDLLFAAQELLDELEGINDFSKKFHHSSNPDADNEIIDDTELQAYVQRTLDVIGGF